jgi:hypothetical protein
VHAALLNAIYSIADDTYHQGKYWTWLLLDDDTKNFVCCSIARLELNLKTHNLRLEKPFIDIHPKEGSYISIQYSARHLFPAMTLIFYGIFGHI